MELENIEVNYLDVNLDNLDSTNDNIDFSGIDEDLERFQKDETVKQALNQGVDLRGYAKEIDNELREVELMSVREYVAQSGSLVELNHQIKACDETLARMQEMLLGFQADLGGISEEIKHLQDQSVSMNVKLRNRRAAEEKVFKFLEQIVVPPDLAKVICSSEVQDTYLEAVTQLGCKLRYLSTAQTQNPDIPSPGGMTLQQQQHLKMVGLSISFGVAPSQTEAGRAVLPQLTKLKAKAITKIREYFLNAMTRLRQPKTNVTMIQQQYLLKYAPLMVFLEEHAPSVSEEIRLVYVDIMGKNLLNLFKAYHTQLIKLELDIATQADTIVLEENAVRNFFSTKVDLTKRNDAFSLQQRDKILEQIEDGPILLHVAQAEGKKLPYEVIHRSLMKHLMDCASSEYLFSLEFFPGHAIKVFDALFSRVWQLVLETLENHLFTCHDAIGVLLLIQVTHAHRRVMQRRRVPALDSLLDRIIMMLWPRFKVLFDNNIRSVKQANPRKLGVANTHPHYITRRYAEFAASILVLHNWMTEEAFLPGGAGAGGSPAAGALGGEEMVMNDLCALGDAVNELLERLAAQLPSTKQRTIFLVNNCDVVIVVLEERQVGVGCGAGGGRDEAARWEERLKAHRDVFVEEELLERYSRLIAFVQQSEAVLLAQAEGGPELQVDEQTMEMLIRDFSASWRSGMESINQDVLAHFSNFNNGKEVLKAVLTQLMFYNQRFQEILKKIWRKGMPGFTRELVTTATMLAEVKKYGQFF